MKKFISMTVFSVIVLLTVTKTASAAPPPTNLNVVDFFPTGPHAIPMQPNNIVLEGADLVMRRGNTSKFHQWFINGEVGYHTVWNTIKNGKCPPHGVVIENAYPQWGYYLEEGATYCTITNEFRGIFPPSWLD